jgi:hypothetical protein
MATRNTRILILCKTYPSPSGKHIETSCVAGMEDGGQLIRLFPVPFRLVSDDKQFKKWQWIEARITKAANDHRPESHRLFVDTISCKGSPLSTKRNWEARRTALAPLSIREDFAALEEERGRSGRTLGLLRPQRIIGLDITPADQADWTEEERQKLVQHERQGGLFQDADAKRIATLRKVPFDFHFRYLCVHGSETREYRHKIADWEVGALYWNCRRRYGRSWEKEFRAKLEKDLPAADLIFLMGTIHRFPNQWLIVSLIYPPKQPEEQPRQQSLFEQ